MPRTLRRSPLTIVARLLIASAVLLVGAPMAPAAAWNNGGPDPGYGTHDWVLDAALVVLDGRADGWFQIATARQHSDDPDNGGHSGENDHVYRDTGIRGGAVHRVAEHYAAAVRAHKAGNFAAASREIGLMSHFYSDIMMPWHSHYDGIGASGHLEYEQQVGARQTSPTAASEWHSSRRTVSVIADARKTAIAAASYSRGFFPELHAEFTKNMGTLNTRVREITRLLMVRMANDLADMIWSISQGKGVPPNVAKLDTSVKWTYAAQNEPWQGVFVTATDTAGKPIEGLRVEITLPIPHGSTTKTLVWTDHAGQAKWAGGIGTSPLMEKRTVTARATTDGTTVTGSTWFVTSPTLAAGLDGFRTSISNARPVAGETVTVSSVVRDTSGRPVKGLEVDWTWDYGHTKIVTRALTDANGVARSSRLVTSTTTFSTVKIAAHTVSASKNRYSNTSFTRQPGGTATEPYEGWFVDIWDSKFRDDIVWLAEEGITAGCGDQLFCPNGLVTRAQMATFLVRALDLPSTTKDYFADDADSRHQASINALAASGITSGCASGRFCPDGLVTRAQMASFLVRAFKLPPTSTDYFGDDAGSKHEDNINRLAASGITSGCGTNRFCPAGSVTRGQMSAFLRRGITR
ncbi:MAG TPA: S-layer homology domain-containing protein [Candidatus Angelobacter sp.]|nr:S-layer homology domain-containing protein [Candidatus Angelobacter sp.]